MTAHGAADTMADLTDLRALLAAYVARWPNEAHVAARFTALLDARPDCLLRSCPPGHLTGAALVTTPALDRVLLTHHRALDIWVHLGGHADGDGRLERVALKEAEEESGLRSLTWLAHPLLMRPDGSPLPFDLDIHAIPASPRAAAHLHYDVRFILVATHAHHEAVIVSEESHDVRWFTLPEARALTSEVSMHRQFDKLESLRVS